MPESHQLIVTLRMPTANVETAETLLTRIRNVLAAIENITITAHMTTRMDEPPPT